MAAGALTVPLFAALFVCGRWALTHLMVTDAGLVHRTPAMRAFAPLDGPLPPVFSQAQAKL